MRNKPNDREEARQRLKKQVEANQRYKQDEEFEREVAQRQATGKKFCRHKYYGFDSRDSRCAACSDNAKCINDTKKRFQTVAEQLSKTFADETCYDKNDWANLNDIDIDQKRQELVEYVQGKMVEIEEDPYRLRKVKELSELTNRTLDAIASDWKQFRQQEPKLHREDLFSRLSTIWDEAAEEVIAKVFGESGGDVHDAWREIVNEEFYAKERKEIVTGLYKRLVEYADEIKETFEQEFAKGKRQEEPWPAKWMTNDKDIRAMLNKYPHFVSILNVMMRKRKHLNYDESLILAEKVGFGTYRDAKGQERRIAPLPESLTPEVIAKEIGKSVSLVHKYLKAMIDIGVLMRSRQTGPNAYSVYSIGYWAERQNKQKGVLPFLQKWLYGKGGPSYQKLLSFSVDYNVS
jgi:hypothetical protein